MMKVVEMVVVMVVMASLACGERRRP